MGYQITFTPSEEKMQSYKPWNEQCSESLVQDLKYELLSYCMLKFDEPVLKLRDTIKIRLNLISNYLEQEAKANAYDRWSKDKDHHLWYCGWEFSKPCDLDKESIINDTLSKLSILTNLVETPNYFSDRENFYKKYEEIQEILDDFEDLMYTIAIHHIIEDLEEFKLKDDDDDEDENSEISD